MAVTLVPVNGLLLTIANQTIYTCPTGKQTIVANATLCNTDSAAHQPSIYLVESGGSKAAKHAMLDGIAGGPGDLSAGESRRLSELEGKFLDAGDTIQGNADADSLIAISLMVIEIDV